MITRSLPFLLTPLLLAGWIAGCGNHSSKEGERKESLARAEGDPFVPDPASVNPDAHLFEEPDMPRISVDPIAELQDPSPRVRAQAILELKKEPTPEEIRLIENTVKDSDSNVSAMGGRALGELYLRGKVPAEALVARIQDETLPTKTQTGLLLGLSKKVSPEATNLLLDLISNGSTEQRRFAAGMIAHQGHDVAIPALRDALNDPDEWVRFNAQEALDNIASGDYQDPKARARSRPR